MIFLDKTLLPFNERKIIFQKNISFANFCIKNKIYDYDIIGDINYLLKFHHEKSVNLFTNDDWSTYYFESGKNRLLKIDDGDKNSFNLNNYFGRTPDEIFEIIKKYYNGAIERNIEMSIKNERELFSFCHFLIIDMSYMQYYFVCSCLKFLKSLNDGLEYRLTDGITSTNYAVDILGYKNNVEIAAYRCKANGSLPIVEKDKNEVYESLIEVPVKILQSKDIKILSF